MTPVTTDERTTVLTIFTAFISFSPLTKAFRPQIALRDLIKAGRVEGNRPKNTTETEVGEGLTVDLNFGPAAAREYHARSNGHAELRSLSRRDGRRVIQRRSARTR